MRAFIKTLGVLTLSVIILLFAGCHENSIAKINGKSTLHVGMVTSGGGINDQSFNQSAWEGLKAAQKDLGIVPAYKEALALSTQKSSIEMFADEANVNLILGVGYSIAQDLENAAHDYPNKKFVVVDNAYQNAPSNLTSLTFKVSEASFLAGYIAAETSKTGKLGFVGGTNVKIINDFLRGFEAGANYSKKLTAPIAVKYVDSFTDTSKAKLTALNMYRKGYDVVMQAAGGAGDGVIEAAKEQNKWVVGVDRDQSYLAPDNVLTSVVKRVDKAVYFDIQQMIKNPSKPLVSHNLGLKEGTVGVVYGKNIPADLQTQTKKLAQQIIDGTIQIPAKRPSQKGENK